MLNMRTESIEDMVSAESVENLMLIAVFGRGDIQRQAREELQRRCGAEGLEAFDDYYMTNLSMSVL